MLCNAWYWCEYAPFYDRCHRVVCNSRYLVAHGFVLVLGNAWIAVAGLSCRSKSGRPRSGQQHRLLHYSPSSAVWRQLCEFTPVRLVLAVRKCRGRSIGRSASYSDKPDGTKSVRFVSKYAAAARYRLQNYVL